MLLKMDAGNGAVRRTDGRVIKPGEEGFPRIKAGLPKSLLRCSSDARKLSKALSKQGYLTGT